MSSLWTEAGAWLKKGTRVFDSTLAMAREQSLEVIRPIVPTVPFAGELDECYALVGAVKSSWEGISGGAAIEREVPGFFEGIRRRAVVTAR